MSDTLQPVVWPRAFFKAFQKTMNASCDYGDLSEDAKDPRWLTFMKAVDGANQAARGASIEAHQTRPVPSHIAQQMRSAINIDRAGQVHTSLLKDIDTISRRYAAGEGIVEISQGRCYPPAGVFRRILLHRGMSAAAVKTVVGHAPSAEAPLGRWLAPRDIEQLKAAWAADSSNPASTARRAVEAAVAEDEFVAWFRTLGVPFKTQNELADEQIAEFGRAIITPDVLITGELYVDGVRLYWIDFKDYVGCPLHYIVTSCREQAAKYTLKWGRGAFCFRGGHVEGFNIDLGDVAPGKNPLVLAYRRSSHEESR